MDDMAAETNSCIDDRIGKFSVEADTSVICWRMMSCAFMNICSTISRNSGHIHFYCSHKNPPQETTLIPSNPHHEALKRFSYYGNPFQHPPPISMTLDFNLIILSKYLSNWLVHDRFGLDMKISRLLIEQLPGVENCRKYFFLEDNFGRFIKRPEDASVKFLFDSSAANIYSDDDDNVEEEEEEAVVQDWVQILTPVQHMKSNMGSGIKRRIYQALAKNPPTWVRKILEISVSRDVYKANACGKTKGMIMSLLNEEEDSRNR
ncbi:hypothetical protein ZOSMA_50G00670 [Zostera marina]|nr:hypothetical protein ZOSMA_50G00670 [Zostera marina]